MKNFEEGIALIAEQEKIINAAWAEKVRIKEEMAERLSPIKVGDVVTANFGYAHIGKRIVVDSITVRTETNYRGEVGFIASGYVLKKDGTAGGNWAEHYAAPKTDN